MKLSLGDGACCSYPCQTRLLPPLAPHWAPAGRAGLTGHPSPALQPGCGLAFRHPTPWPSDGAGAAWLGPAAGEAWSCPAGHPRGAAGHLSAGTVSYRFVFKLFLNQFEAHLLPSSSRSPSTSGFLRREERLFYLDKKSHFISLFF